MRFKRFWKEATPEYREVIKILYRFEKDTQLNRIVQALVCGMVATCEAHRRLRNRFLYQDATNSRNDSLSLPRWSNLAAIEEAKS